jgi:hypothetical protein
MAKVQGKKGAAGVKKSAGKKTARPAARKVKAVAKKKVSKPVAAVKHKAAKPTKPPKPAARAAAVKRGGQRPSAVQESRGRQSSTKKAAPAAKHVAPPARPAAPPPRPPAPVAEKKRTRRSRPRLSSSGPPTAAWFSQGEKPRSSSFIPAPPRAEAPSLIAAPPASSDRLVADHELTEFAVRTVPVRVDVEAGGGRVFISTNPDEVTLRVGEGIEWDFRYLGGADVIIDELIVEFDKPSPFSSSTFRSRRPGTARPHRQLSGPAHKEAAGKRLRYTIRAMNAFKSEMASSKSHVTIA